MAARPGPVLDMLDEIGEASRAEAWFDDAFAKGTTLMGFGHRIYKVRDPRADVLKAAVATLPATAGRLAYASAVEQGAIAALRKHKPGRRLDTNVEYYTALLLEALEIPRSAFTALFAVGRTAGWCAHVFEQEKGGRIIRPQSNYVGRGPWRSSSERGPPGPLRKMRTWSPRRPERPSRRPAPGPARCRRRRTPRRSVAPAGVKRTLKWRRQKLPSAWANSASVPSSVGPHGQRRRARLGPRVGRRPATAHAVDQRAEAQRLAVVGGLHRAAVDAQPRPSAGRHRRRGWSKWTPKGVRSSRSTCGMLGRRIDVLERDRAIEAHGAGVAAEPFRPQAGLGRRAERRQQGGTAAKQEARRLIWRGRPRR